MQVTVGIINLKSSLLVSLLSGLGLAGVLMFAPNGRSSIPSNKLKKTYQIDEGNPVNNGSYTFSKPKISSPDESLNSGLNIYLQSKRIASSPTVIYSLGIQPSHTDQFWDKTSSNQLDNNLSFSGENFVSYKDSSLSVNGIVDPMARNYHNTMNSTSKYMIQDIYGSSYNNKNMTYRSIDLNYQISSLMTASVKSYGADNFSDDKIRVTPTTSAGLSFSGIPYITAGFMAGEQRSNNMLKYTAPGASSPASFINRDNDTVNKDIDKRNIFEVNTSIAPTKNIQFQSAIYNSNKAALNELSPNEGARFSMNLGFRFIMLNVKYNYSSDNFMKNGIRFDQSQNARDYAGIGITMFLDRFNQYSLSIGNNYHNLMTQGRYSEVLGLPPVSSFSASLRGKHTTTNAIFFVNFRNQMSRDQYYSSMGLFRFPLYSQVNFDYATSMGMELTF